MGTFRRKMIFILASVVVAIMAMLLIYSALIATGVVSARKEKLIIQVKSIEKEYDGTEYMPSGDDGYNLLYGSLKDGHTLTVTYAKLSKEAGESQISIMPTITDVNGTDVTEYYDIQIINGTYKVNPKIITISVSNPYPTKQYDGEPLFNKEITLEGELIEGHELVQGEYYATQTEIGSCANEVEVDVVDGEGKSVAENYSIHYNLGTLTVLPNTLKLTSASAEVEYQTGITLTNDTVTCDADGIEILKHFNHNIAYSVTGSQVGLGKSQNLFTATITDADGTDVTDMYDVQPVYGVLNVYPIKIEIKAGDASKPYDGEPLTYRGMYPTGDCCFEKSTQKLLSGHKIVGECEGSQTQIGTGANRPQNVKITTLDDVDVTDYYDITLSDGELKITGRKITIKGVTAYHVYDDQLISYAQAMDGNTEYGVVTSGELAEGHTLITSVQQIDKQYRTANACTLTTEGYIYDNYRYELIAQIVDENGVDVTTSYDPTVYPCALVIKPRPITVQSYSGNWAYDGNAHKTADVFADADWTEVSDNVVAGHSLNVEVISTITEVGTAVNDFVVTLENSAHENVTSNYIIEKQYGELEVHKEENKLTIYVATPNGEFEYDGTEKATDRLAVTVTDQSELAEGHQIDMAYGFITNGAVNAGTYENRVIDGGFRVIDLGGNDVSAMYVIGYQNQSTDLGRLRILPRELEIRTDSASKEYDGTPLTATTSYMVGDTSKLLAGHTLQNVTVNGIITYAGFEYNTAELTVTDALGNDVSQNYTTMQSALGVLTVTPKTLLIALQPNQIVYSDGGVVDQSGLNFVVTGLVSGDGISVISLDINTDILNSYTTVSGINVVVIVNSVGQDITTSYNVNFQEGEIFLLEQIG